MKNIAIPLLLAGSAKAEAKKKAAMLFDYAMPEPILIASSWTGDVCVDAASDVSAALSALQTAQAAVTESSEGVAALELAQTEALEARVEAVAAVTELADSMETAVSNNNAAIDTWFARKATWQEAANDASVGQANKITLAQATVDALGNLDAEKEIYWGTDELGGLLADTATALSNKEAAEAIRDNADATTVGSLALRNAQSTVLGNTNCAAIATGATGTLGDDDYQLQCASAGLSLTEMDAAAAATLVLRDNASLAMARTYLLERELFAIDKTIGWAENAAASNSSFSTGTLLTTTLLETPTTQATKQDKPRTAVSPGVYTAGTWYAAMAQSAFTATASVTNSQADVIQGMTDNDTTPTTSALGTAATTTATTTWMAKMRLVYGDQGASGPVDNDGDGSSVDSEEYKLEQTGATGAEDFIVVARAQVVALRALVVATFTNTPQATDVSSTSTNAKEIIVAANACVDSADAVDATCTGANADKSTCEAATASSNSASCVWYGPGDGYAGAFTLTVNSANNGAMAAATGITLGSAITWGTANPVYDASTTYTLDFAYGASAGDVGNTATGAASMCAAVCTALAPWNMDSDYLPILQATTAMSTTECTGFQLTVAAAGTEPECKLIYGGIPTTDAADNSVNATVGTFSRNWSVKAQTYLTAVASANTVAGTATAWDYFDAGMTSWDTAYKNLIDARAALNLAIQYTTDITATWSGSGTGTQDLYEVSGVSGAKYDWDADVVTYNQAVIDYNADLATYDAKVISIATARSDYALAQAQWASNNASISKLTVLHEIATAASGASLLAEQALNGIWTDAASASDTAAETYEGVSDGAASPTYTGGQVNALATALENLTTAEEAVTGVAGTEAALGVYAASTDVPAGSGNLGDLFALRATAGTAFTDLTDAMAALSTLNLTIEGQQRDVELRLADHLSAIVACKVENYDNYTQTLQLAIGAREEDLEDILALVTQAEADAPAAGEAGWRCEKALSNGTFRPTRGETTCNENLCCGAASVPVGEAVMTIETCQSSDTTTYSYVPPRGPMETTAPAADTFPFVCIEGAQKLAAAASALATAVYMLA